MTHEETWKVLSDLLTKLRKAGEPIPVDVVEDLRSAKTLIHVLKADPSHVENIPQIETFLRNVGSHLIFAAQNRFGSGLVDEWFDKLDEARRAVGKETEAVPQFVRGLPRKKHWVRVKISEDIPREEVKRLAEEKNLSYRLQEDDFVLVSGDSRGIKSFVKTMTERFSKKRKQ